jgi:two-component system chemotaxis response regulator CheY
MMPDSNFQRPERILIVDDQTYFRTMVRDQVRRLGFQHVFEAADGHEGLDMLIKVEPDLILLDINMKPMDGLDFLALVRNSMNVPDPKVPTIFLTSHAESDKVKRAIELGAAGYLVKPIAFMDLRARITTALSKRAKKS